MISGAPVLRKSVCRGHFGLLGCSSLFSGTLDAEVNDAWNDSWRGSFMGWLYLVAKPSNVGVDVDGLAYPLHRPLFHSCQMRGQSLPLGDVLSCHCSRWWHLSGDVKPPGSDIWWRVDRFVTYTTESCIG
jgi:hypothetical protein